MFKYNNYTKIESQKFKIHGIGIHYALHTLKHLPNLKKYYTYIKDNLLIYDTPTPTFKTTQLSMTIIHSRLPNKLWQSFIKDYPTIYKNSTSALKTTQQSMTIIHLH